MNEEDKELEELLDSIEDTESSWQVSPQINIKDIDWNITFDDIITDISYGVKPQPGIPEVYTSHEQRERHEKYPALQKMWEDYISMYNLTKGEPPYVE